MEAAVAKKQHLLRPIKTESFSLGKVGSLEASIEIVQARLRARGCTRKFAGAHGGWQSRDAGGLLLDQAI